MCRTGKNGRGETREQWKARKRDEGESKAAGRPTGARGGQPTTTTTTTTTTDTTTDTTIGEQDEEILSGREGDSGEDLEENESEYDGSFLPDAKVVMDACGGVGESMNTVGVVFQGI